MNYKLILKEYNLNTISSTLSKYLSGDISQDEFKKLISLQKRLKMWAKTGEQVPHNYIQFKLRNSGNYSSQKAQTIEIDQINDPFLFLVIVETIQNFMAEIDKPHPLKDPWQHNPELDKFLWETFHYDNDFMKLEKSIRVKVFNSVYMAITMKEPKSTDKKIRYYYDLEKKFNSLSG